MAVLLPELLVLARLGEPAIDGDEACVDSLESCVDACLELAQLVARGLIVLGHREVS